MVKIRYSELPAGLHVSAEHDGRDTIIYLQPGLTAEQRRAALVRVRSSARMGHWPGITSFGMAMAVSADKLRTTFRNGAAAMRGAVEIGEAAFGEFLPRHVSPADAIENPRFRPVKAPYHERSSDSACNRHGPYRPHFLSIPRYWSEPVTRTEP